MVTLHASGVAGRAMLVTLACASALAAEPAPKGPHPRLFLDSGTAEALAQQWTDPSSPVARGAKRCKAAREHPAKYSEGGWQGFEFVTTLSSCLVAWKAGGDAADLGTAIQYFRVLLDDYQSVGDGAGGDDVVRHDSGYAMRTFAPFSALAYDWLHDAPGVDEELRSRARQRFAAWMAWYADAGYLRHTPGANYHAGWVFAATLIAIAEAGEAGSAGDEHWTTVRDVIWGKDMKEALGEGGVLSGGDWPEGWQYGSLSVLEYALSMRALSANGVSVENAEPWASALVDRYRHALTPVTLRLYVAGDTDAPVAHLQPPSGPLIAAIAGPASESARAWARLLESELGLEDENPMFDALAWARSGPVATRSQKLPKSHFASGAGNWYVRGAWVPETVWSVLSCSRRRVPDHQHNDAGNFVLTRGADDLVVDPSPYGSLSSLSSNAPAVDSAVLPPGYSPSQGDWGKSTRFVWTKQLVSGVAMARCDYADQFRYEDQASDVSPALRDFVLIPSGADGTLVVLDRVTTSGSLRLRVRTPAVLALDGDVARAALGASALFVRRLWSSGGAPHVREMPRASECSASERDSCDGSRLPEGWEYRLEVAGPTARSIHVVDVTASDSSVPDASLLEGESSRAVALERGGRRVAVVANDSGSGSFDYRVARGASALHVVLDAPAGSQGHCRVEARLDGSDCVVTVSALEGLGGFDALPLAFGVSESCVVSPEDEEPVGGFGGASASPRSAPPDGGCGCRAGGSVGDWAATFGALALTFALFRRRRAPSPGSGRCAPARRR